MTATHQSLAQKITTIASHSKRTKNCLVGFDGFTDEIIDVVDQRLDCDSYTPLTTISSLETRIGEAAGKSCNLELVTKRKKIGGNAPIFAHALLVGGHQVSFIGAIGGKGEVEPLFHDFADRCQKVISLCPSGHTDALEFQDGKILLGKTEQLKMISYSQILKFIDKEELVQMFDHADLFASCNWTMLPNMTSLWEKIIEEVLPRLHKRQRWMFIDLADPAKRSEEDLRQALKTLSAFSQTYDVVLGLNESEARQVAKTFNKSATKLSTLALDLVQALDISRVVIHTTKNAFSATRSGSQHSIKGPYCPTPHTSTGGGDHFNAGYCHGLLFDLSEEESLLWAVTTSGFYVREGKSPTLSETITFLKKEV